MRSIVLGAVCGAYIVLATIGFADLMSAFFGKPGPTCPLDIGRQITAEWRHRIHER